MNFDQAGILACARFAFAPNQLHFCGPEKQTDLLSYIGTNSSDQGLVEILNRFETLYPYLELIALENNLRDPFDQRVVEAYWMGNNLLTQAKFRPFAKHLTDTLQLKKSLSQQHFSKLLEKLEIGVPQHTFHVLNIFRRTGHQAIPHTLSTMDNCRVSWGKVVHSSEFTVQSRICECLVEVKLLEYDMGKLKLGKPILKKVTSIGLTPKVGEWVSLHWGYICSVLNLRQLQNLRYYTELAINLANRHL